MGYWKVTNELRDVAKGRGQQGVRIEEKVSGREKKLRMRKEKVKKQEQGEGRVEGKGGEERGRGGGGGGGGRGMVGESKYGCPGHKTSPAARSRTNIRTFPKTNPISPPPTNMVARVY